MKEAKTRFYLDTRKNKDGRQRIKVDVSIRSTKVNSQNVKRYSPITFSSGCVIEQKYFGSKGTTYDEAVLKKYAMHNTKLKRIRKELIKIEEAVNDVSYDFYVNKITPDRADFKKALFIQLECIKAKSELSVLEYLYKIIEEDRKAVDDNKESPRGKNTIKGYVSLSRLFENYHIAKNTTIMFSDFTHDFYWEFFNVCDQIYRDEIKVINPNQTKKPKKDVDGYSVSSINKMGKTIRSLLRMAIVDGFDFPLDLNDRRKPLSLKVKKKPTKPILLTEAEFIKIINADVSRSHELLNAQQYLIIASLTGLRIGDMSKLYMLEVQEFDNQLKAYIGVDTDIKKVNSEAIPPLLKHVRDVVSRNDGKFPKFEEKAVNKSIKLLCELLGIDETVSKSKLSFKDKEYKITNMPKYEAITTHVCRHSFISNLALHHVDEAIIMALTHPKKTDSENNMFNVYFKADNTYKSSRLLKALEEIDSEVYTYD